MLEFLAQELLEVWLEEELRHLLRLLRVPAAAFHAFVHRLLELRVERVIEQVSENGGIDRAAGHAVGAPTPPLAREAERGEDGEKKHGSFEKTQKKFNN